MDANPIIIINFLCVVFFLSLVGKGMCQCTSADLKITQIETGTLVNNKPQHKVTISNQCICSQLDVTLKCDGFQTAETIDPSILSRTNGGCFINNGQPIYGNHGFDFTYAWDNEFPFELLSSQIACS